MKIYEKIKFIRDTLKLNQKEFAEIFKTTHATISRYEKNEREPSIDFLEHFINVFEINPMWIFNKSDIVFLKDDLCYQSLTIAKNIDEQEELEHLLNTFVDKHVFLAKISRHLERANSLKFFYKLCSISSFSKDYYQSLLHHLKSKNIVFSNDTCKHLHQALILFNASQTIKIPIDVLDFAEHELDNASACEIIVLLSVLQESLKKD